MLLQDRERGHFLFGERLHKRHKSDLQYMLHQGRAETIREALNRSGDGDPMVFINKRLLDPDGNFRVQDLIGDLAGEWMGDRILETRLMILKDYLTRIGVRTVGMEKREHLLDQEIAENNDETSAEPTIGIALDAAYFAALRYAPSLADATIL